MILPLLSYAALFLLSVLLLRAVYRHNPRLPPSPPGLPIIGHLHLVGPKIHRSFHELSGRYGPLMLLRLGSVPAVVASSPEAAREILKTNESSFSMRPNSAAIDHLTYGAAFAFAEYGPYWRFVKKLSVTQLLGPQNLSHFAPIRSLELREFLKGVMRRAEKGEPVNLTEALLELMNNVISQTMMSVRCSGTATGGDGGGGGGGGKGEAAREVAREVTGIFGEFNVSDFLWILKNWDVQGFRRRFEGIRRRYDDLIERIITDREAERKRKKEEESDDGMRKDFLGLLLDVMEDKNAAVKITRIHIKALILDFFTAGTDTSATTVEWAFAELLNHPDALAKAREEIDRVVGNRRLVAESDAANLPYINAILKESFRLHPPIPLVNRKCIQDCEIGGFLVPKNSMIFISNWAMGRDPSIWASPLEFRPERFIDEGKDVADVKGQHFQLLPFGSGRRGCPGLGLAMLELPTVLAAMIQCFDWKVEGLDQKTATGDPVPVDMEERPGLTVPRARDLECVPVVRSVSLDIFNDW